MSGAHTAAPPQQTSAAQASDEGQEQLWINIQVLRAIAAYLVVGHHLVDSWNNYTGAHFGRQLDIVVGAAGVDIFFVLSGFVMVEATRGRAISPASFLYKRIVRVVPLYWLFTLLAAIGIAAGFRMFGGLAADLPDVIRSLLFLPMFTAEGAVRSPILFVGWSLNYEMFFYAAFAVALGFKSLTRRVLAVVALFVVLSMLARTGGNQILLYYTDQRIWEFVLGMMVACAGGALRATAHRHGAKPGWLLAGLGAGLLAATSLQDTATVVRAPFWFHGLPAALIVLGAAYLEVAGRPVRSPALRLQGDASYSLYLTHPFVLQAMGKIVIVLGLNATIGGALVGYALMGAGACIVGNLVYRCVEQPLLDRSRRLAGLSRRAPAGAGVIAQFQTLGRPHAPPHRRDPSGP